MKGWDMISEIKVMLVQGRSVSSVSRQLGIDRKTVRKYRDLAMDEIAVKRRQAQRRSRKVDAYAGVIDDLIERMLEDGVVNAQSIYHQIQELGFTGSARSIRRYVAIRSEKKRSRQRIYKPFETSPGHQSMVDMGESRKVWIDGRRMVRHFLVMTLSWSRKMYVEWYDRSPDTEMFLRFHENAFREFGGIPCEIVYDQTKLVALEERYGEIDFNRAFHGFAQWCGFRTWLCRKNDPETKGKVESSVQYIKRSFLPGRRFDDPGDLAGQWSAWLSGIADVKPNETTCEAPADRLEKEREKLKPLRDSVYPCRPAFRRQPVSVDGLVKVLGNRYSIPAPYHRKTVKIRITESDVEIYSDKEELLHTHTRCFEKGKRIIHRAHYYRTPKVSTESLEEKMLQIYQCQTLLDELKQRFPRHYREQMAQLIRLADRMDHRLLRKACETVLNLHRVSYISLRKVANHYHEKAFEQGIEMLDIPHSFHSIPSLTVEQRSLDEYDRILEER